VAGSAYGSYRYGIGCGWLVRKSKEQKKIMKTKKTKSKAGSIFIVTGIALILAALALVVFNRWDDWNAGKIASETLKPLQQQISTSVGGGTASPSEMPMTEVNGRSYIGIVSIPTLGLTLPVQNEWNYPNLRKAPCRYQGSVYTHSLIIAGHNYQGHFGRLNTLNVGDAVQFTDVRGNTFDYQVSSMETIDKYDVSRMKSGKWDLTLFTCTIGGKKRVTVRCTQMTTAASAQT
jgi:sortase A